LPDSHQRALKLLELDEEEPVLFEAQEITAEVDRYFAVPTKDNKDSITFWLVCYIEYI
jgi:hypothetical protein